MATSGTNSGYPFIQRCAENLTATGIGGAIAGLAGCAVGVGFLMKGKVSEAKIAFGAALAPALYAIGSVGYEYKESVFCKKIFVGTTKALASLAVQKVTTNMLDRVCSNKFLSFAGGVTAATMGGYCVERWTQSKQITDNGLKIASVVAMYSWIPGIEWILPTAVNYDFLDRPEDKNKEESKSRIPALVTSLTTMGYGLHCLRQGNTWMGSLVLSGSIPALRYTITATDCKESIVVQKFVTGLASSTLALTVSKITAAFIKSNATLMKKDVDLSVIRTLTSYLDGHEELRKMLGFMFERFVFTATSNVVVQICLKGKKPPLKKIAISGIAESLGAAVQFKLSSNTIVHYKDYWHKNKLSRGIEELNAIKGFRSLISNGIALTIDQYRRGKKFSLGRNLLCRFFIDMAIRTESEKKFADNFEHLGKQIEEKGRAHSYASFKADNPYEPKLKQEAEKLYREFIKLIETGVNVDFSLDSTPIAIEITNHPT